MNKSLQALKTTLLNVDHVYLNRKWNHDNVISAFSRIYLINQGHASVYHHEKEFQLKAGHAYLIPAFTYSTYKCNKHLEQIYIHFLEEIGSGLSIYNMRGFRYEIKATPLVKQLFLRLLELNPNRALQNHDPKIYDNLPATRAFEEKNNSQSSGVYIETNAILQILLSQFIEEKNAGPYATKHNTSRITQVLYHISEHLSETLTVEDMARRCHINADYFSRLFKEQTDMGPLQYIQVKRIERAKVLLTTTNYSLQSIADMIGLPNISYFNRLFSKLTGTTPAAYRKKHWTI